MSGERSGVGKGYVKKGRDTREVYIEWENVINTIVHHYVILVFVQHLSESKFLREFTEFKGKLI